MLSSNNGCISSFMNMQALKALVTTGPCSGKHYDPAIYSADANLPKGIRGLVSGDENPMLLIADLNQALGDIGIVLGRINDGIIDTFIVFACLKIFALPYITLVSELTIKVKILFSKGTPAGTTTSLFLEPALLPSYEEESEFIDEDLTSDEEVVDVPGAQPEPLYIALQDCSSLSHSQIEGITRASCVTELVLGRPLECVTLYPSW